MGSLCSCCKKTTVVEPAPVKERKLSVRKPSYVGNLNDLGISTTDPLRLIDGYEREPLVSLEESLAPFDGYIQYLPDQISRAKTNCYYSNPHGLTRDESAAIYLYSMQGDPNSVHEHLERAWKTNDRSQMKPWFRYLRLLKSGLNKLPDAKGEVWKGTAYDPNLANTLQSNSLPFYTCMGSCSTSMNEVRHDLHGKSGSRMILAGYKSVDGKDASGYTANKSNTGMIWPGAKVNKLKSGETDDSGSFIMHLTGSFSK